jgi:DNA-binding MarR family transcriptional regulator
VSTDQGRSPTRRSVRAQTLQRGLQDLRIELSIFTDKIAQAAGLNPRDLDVLDVVVHDGGLNPKQLAARTGIDPATLTGVLTPIPFN